jgi:hypothetical protein
MTGTVSSDKTKITFSPFNFPEIGIHYYNIELLDINGGSK